MKTRNGIYYDLEESPYITKFKDFRFHFSSEFYRRKFENELFEYINKESEKIKNRYKTDIDFSEILSFNLYRSIEKRGCLCVYKNNGLNSFKITNNLNGYIQIKE